MKKAKHRGTRGSTNSRTFVAGIIIVLVACTILIWLLFSSFISNYNENITDESAAHLVEINAQIKLYIEEKISNDWKVARSIANSIDLRTQDELSKLFALMRSERDIWGVADILVYTESGYCVSAGGEIKQSDEAFDLVYEASKDGRYMTIMQSTVTYTIPLESELMMDGSRIAAVSIVQDLDSFIDEMGFSSFDGEAILYLTQSNGVKISQLSHSGAPTVYNIFTLFDGVKFSCLSHEGHAIEATMRSTEICTLLYHDATGDWYTIITPVETGAETWRLFYWIPETVVNATMNGFSSYLTNLSFAIVGVFSACALLVFLFIYYTRKRQFDSALIARDRMFDLLVLNTRNAFALFSTDQNEPLYVSSNVESVINEQYLVIDKCDSGYRTRNASNTETEATQQINLEMQDWDGKSEFRSGFIPNNADGGVHYYVLHIYPVEGSVDEFVGIAQDVTVDREREEALKDALKLADSANLAKTRFLTNMSHDIRTPMNAIMNMTRFAIESLDEPEAHMEYLNTILDSSDHLLHIINDILDVSRIESGQAVIDSDPFDIQQCLSEICDMIKPLYEAKHQSFSTDFDSIQSRRLMGDQLKLSQVLINLLNNAVKFTPEHGRIRFTVMEMPSLRSEAAALRFTVEDNGMGISEEALQHIFEPFARSENTQVRYIEGTGLGLTICKSYVTTMGGTISCQSEPGLGSRFTIELFFEKDLQGSAESSTRRNTTQASFTGQQALLCEDNEINRMIACKLLNQLGLEVDLAKDGGEAVEKFISSSPGCYDIIYMDIQMPVMNGYEATAAIRKSHHPQARTIPIVAMTANVFAEDVEKSRAAGMNGHIAKPLVLQEVIEKTQRALQIGE